ncbi:DUF58 domain-containing protein [Pseudomaricurvus sp.]|uniref:DUF58 domain-containing protein n=1 Tax=Pseudomaricurvus sp. TaxID=2004510 RepID=UPI003F6D631F
MSQSVDSSMKPHLPGSPVGHLRQYVQKRFDAWMLPRLKRARSHQLSNKRLFIVPSKAGVGFLSVVVLLWLTGTNYENNIVLGLAFFLTALFVVCIHHTFFNMSGLVVDAVGSAPCFLGEDGEVEIRVSCSNSSDKESIALSFSKGRAATIDLLDTHSVTVKLFTRGEQRGWYYPPRLKVESFFPLGIIRCWSWLVLDAPILVYPKPEGGSDMPLSQSSSHEGERMEEAGAEDFHGFKPYQLGVSPKHIAWKHYARGQGLYSKEYASYREQSVWLDWDALEGLGTEARLSRLCYWVIKLSSTQQPYGLRLPGQAIPPAMGVDHKHQLLKTLALYRSEGGK